MPDWRGFIADCEQLRSWEQDLASPAIGRHSRHWVAVTDTEEIGEQNCGAVQDVLVMVCRWRR
jgi:hypothetical protein